METNEENQGRGSGCDTATGSPLSDLPSWEDCKIRVANREFIEKEELNINDFPEPHNMPNELHEFLYEYDESDDYKSAWFRHRLERLINKVKSNPELF